MFALLKGLYWGGQFDNKKPPSRVAREGEGNKCLIKKQIHN
jgi:hypothetical protein